MPLSVSESRDLAENLGRVALLIAITRASVARGQWVDVAPIEASVRTLCDAISPATPPRGTTLVDRLAFLQNELELLAEDLLAVIGDRFSALGQPSQIGTGG